MNKVLAILLLSISLVLSAQVTMYRGTSFRVPRGCKHLAILGSTPHPTKFLARGGTMNDLKKIKVADFVDIEYLRDSFKNTLQRCMQHNVDHLLIAYLPAHFVAQRAAYPLPMYERGMHHFLRRIGSCVTTIIREVVKELGCTIPITLVLPPRKILKTVPFAFDSNEHRVQHYIRSFPLLKGLRAPSLHVLIVNNRGSDQNEAIMKYLSYEYVLEVPLQYTVLELEKDKFHKYV